MKASRGMGKLPGDYMEKVIFGNLGSPSSKVVVGPGLGLDNSVLSLGKGNVMILTSDPVSIIPAIGMEASARLSVRHLASDYSTCGLMPEFAVFEYNLPPRLAPEEFEEYVEATSRECKELGISIVGGHTGNYPGIDYTIVGGGTLLGFGKAGEYVTPAMARQGDRILVTKGSAIGTTAVLANSFSIKLRESLGPRTIERAKSFLSMCSTVEEARIASSMGLKDVVTSMHDATEGGVLGAVSEVAFACGKSATVDLDQVVVSEEARAVCSFFGLDPLTSGSEGSLVITVRPERAVALQRKLLGRGIESASIGEIGGRKKRGLWVTRGGSRPKKPELPGRDPYWAAYSRATAEGWR